MLHRRHAISRDPVSPVLVVILDDVPDVGNARAGATSTLLRQTEAELVASFDVDQLLDYRSRPPALTVAGLLNGGVSWPEIRLELGGDRHRQDWLLLHGPAPAYRWQAFGADLADLAEHTGVRLVVTLGATPAPVPHTRPCRVLAAGTATDLLDQLDPYSTASLTVTAGIEDTLAWMLGTGGTPAVSLSAQVPSYLADAPYPPASAALLDTLSAVSGLSIDTNRLHTAAIHSQRRIDEHLADDDAHTQRVRALERHFDLSTNGDRRRTTSQVQAEDELVGELSQRLRHRGCEHSDPD